MIESLQSSWQTNAGKIRCRPGLPVEIAKVKRSVFPGFVFSRRTFSRQMWKHVVGSRSSRVSFDLPELLEIQRASFNRFVRHDIPDLFSQLAPIKVESDGMTVELQIDGKNFQLIAPDDTPQECISKLKTYSCKLYVQAKIVCTTLAGEISYSTKDEWVLIGHLPLMTKRGHFIINGSPRVIVHQVVRSPGIYFQQVLDKDEKQKIRFYGDIIPRRGVWLRLQTTKKGKVEAKLKKGKKVSADMLQRCLQSIEKFSREHSPDPVLGLSFEEELFDSKRLLQGDAYVENVANVGAGKTSLPIKFTKSLNNRLALGKLVPAPIKELSTPLKQTEATSFPGEIFFTSPVSQKHTAVYGDLRVQNRTDAFNELIGKSKKSDVEEIDAFASAPEEKALLHTYNKLYRPAEDKEREQLLKKRKSTYSSNNTLIDRRLKVKKCYKNLFSTFKDKGRYDLSILGREKINTKLGICVSENQLTALDIYAASNWLYKLTKGEKNIDDIDHFQNRRIRTSGELLQAQFENGIDRLRRLAWNKLREFVRLQSVQRPVYKLQNPRESEIEVEEKDNNRNTVSVYSKPAFHIRRFPKDTLSKSTTKDSAIDGIKSDTRVLHSMMPGNSSQALSLKEERLYPSYQEVSSSMTPYLRFTYGLPVVDTSPNGLRIVNASYLENSFSPQQKGQKAGDHVLNVRYATLAAPLPQQQLKKLCFPAGRRWVRCEEHESLSEKRESVSHAAWASKETTLVKSLLSKESCQPDSVSILQAKLAATSLKEFLSTKPLNGALRELFGTNPLSQYMDQTNPLAEITHKRRMSSLGVGGVSRESAGMAIRGIHPTHYGRICPIETPEGKNAGLVNSLALYAKIDNRGFVETPYYKVVKGQVQHELGFTFFSAKEESSNHLNVAPSDLQQSWSNMLATDTVPVRVSDNLLDLFKKIDSYQVDCIGISPVQMISVATSLIPFLEHNDANRALMGSNMQRQAVPLMIPERPIVGTGLESLVVAESGHLLQSDLTGFVSYASANKIVVDSLCCTSKDLPFSIPNREKSFKTLNKKLKVHQTFPHRAWEHSESPPITKRKLSVQGGTSPRWAWAQTLVNKRIEGWSAQPGIIISPTQKRSSKGIVEDKELLKKKDVKKNRFLKGNRSYLNRFSIHITGNSCRNGQICSCVRPVSPSPLSDVLSGRISVCKDTFLRNSKQVDLAENFNFGQSKAVPKVVPLSKLAAANCNATLQSIWLKTTSLKQRLTSCTHVFSNFDRSNQDTCLTQRALVKEGDWVQKGDILTDCSASDHGELAVGKNILVAYIPWEGYNFEDAIVISERLVKEHVYTSLHIERYDFNAQDVKEGSEWFTNDLPGIPNKKIKHLDEFGLPKIGSFVKEGDILLGKIRYSNRKPTTPYERLLSDILGENNFSARDSSLYVPKGVHARVVRRKILRSFNDPSRVKSKIGKSPKLVHIFLGEKRAIQVGDKMSGRHGNKGVVATILPRQDMPYLADGTAIDIVLNPLGVPSRMNVGQVYEALLGLAGTYLAQQFKVMSFDELYGVEASQSLVFLKLYQARLQSGQNWLFQVDFPGKTRLIDGRSGECFDQWVTVGKAYILKLIHMVNEKIHARATGPYALITQQPLRGRSQKGGQRLGEMEVWALEGFGAAYILQELLTKKSDDMVGRKEVASAILPRPPSILDIIQPSNRAHENRFVLGQPEIFKVLICELQALCLDVGVYSLTTQSLQRSFLSRVN